MTIRKTLLLAFLGLGLGSSILLTGVGFVKAREALRAEIDRNVRSGADALATEIDKMMFERLQNAAVWSRLDIMQDIQIRDIDKRLAQFLGDLRRGYGDVYVSLSCVDRAGEIVSSSDPAQIGTAFRPAAASETVALSGATLHFSLSGEVNVTGAAVDVPIASAATSSEIGILHLDLDWSEIENVLSSSARENGRIALLLDANGRLIGASRPGDAAHLPGPDALASWRSLAGRVTRIAGQPLVDGEVIVGATRSAGYAGFAGFGWTVLVVQPVSLALAPVHRMALMFLLLLGLIVLITGLIAIWVSHAIADPIAGLTALTRDYAHTRILHIPEPDGVGEVQELTQAFVQMVRDIDLSQKNLVRASKLAVVGEMSSVIAHEVRTPLGILRSSAQVLSREQAISVEGRELVGFIATETERLNRLVSSMLDSARPRAIAYSDVDLHELLRRAGALLNAQFAKKNIRLHLHLRAGQPCIECDEEQMTQVILNIMMNALQILPAGGNITVRTSDESSAIQIDIADDGPGIAVQERGHVFDAFFFKREGGVGLGLAIVAQIVSAHGGSIEAGESDEGGALFHILIPRMQPGST